MRKKLQKEEAEKVQNLKKISKIRSFLNNNMWYDDENERWVGGCCMCWRRPCRSFEHDVAGCEGSVGRSATGGAVKTFFFQKKKRMDELNRSQVLKGGNNNNKKKNQK